MSVIFDFYNPFLQAGRSLGFSNKDIKAYLANGATAKLDGKVVTIAYENQDGKQDVVAVRHSLTGRSKLGEGRRAAKWVNDFNSRAAKAG